jgi:hypothetical protein
MPRGMINGMMSAVAKIWHALQPMRWLKPFAVEKPCSCQIKEFDE